MRQKKSPGEVRLDRIVKRTLRGENVDELEFRDAFEDLMDDIMNEPAAPVTAEDIREAESAKIRFREWLLRYNLPLDNRYHLCETIDRLAHESPSQDLLRMICYLVCDNDLLLNFATGANTVKESGRLPEEDASLWRDIHRESEDLYTTLAARKQEAIRLKSVLAQAKDCGLSRDQRQGTAMRTDRAEAIADAYADIFQVAVTDIFRSNVYALLQTVDTNSSLATIKPLFLYRVLTRHARRMQASDGLEIDLRMIWKYKSYNIFSDNGKNYKVYRQYLSLFESLYDLFAAEDGVDASLCLYGFDQLSNLGDFCRYMLEKDSLLPLEPSVDELLLESTFTCFPNRINDNVAFMESGLSEHKLIAFQFNRTVWLNYGRTVLRGGKHRENAFRKIEDKMNEDADALMDRFLAADPEAVLDLCREVLEQTALTKQEQPSSAAEKSLYLANINRIFMDTADDYALRYLTRAARAIIGEICDFR